MKTSQTGIDLIKKWEGLKTKAYKDVVGVWTIGYGRTKGVTSSMVITPTMAENFLKEDLTEYERYVNSLVKVPLTQSQFDALVSFIYNLGPTNFSRSTLLEKLNAGLYSEAAKEFDKWVYAGGKVYAGLEARRADEKQLFMQTPSPPKELPTGPEMAPIELSDERLKKVIKELLREMLDA